MGLMFQRIARNFIRKGYFPTDEATLERILTALAPAPGIAPLRLLDPTCGEGTAIAELKHALGAERTVAYGIEIDEERAWHAKQLLDVAIHADLLDCKLGQRGFGLVFLNPPYGDLLADRAQTGDQAEDRLEQLLYRAAIGALQPGGVLVLIIPRYSLERRFATWLANGFERIGLFAAATDRFQQIVVLAVRRRHGIRDEPTRERLLAAVGAGEPLPALPDSWPDEPYLVPTSPKPPACESLHIDARQLADECRRHPCLWPQFTSVFGQAAVAARRPLVPPSPWHLALLLAAGAISGVVRAGDGRVMVVRGATHKEQDVKVTIEEVSAGETQVVTTRTDRFVPVIRALDLTPASPTLGETFTIR
jgi:hypothetical protein